MLWRTIALFLALLSWGPSSYAQQKRDIELNRVPPRASTPPSPALLPSKSYALIVGISEYPNLAPKDQLRFTIRDAEAIYSILIHEEGGNFKAENVHKLIGPKATLTNLRHELENWLPSVAKQGDRVLIYFAGHGFVYENKAYLAPYDISREDIARTGYPMASIGSVIGSKINAKNKVLITDACHSGAISPTDDNETINNSLMNLDQNLFSLTASRAREKSYEHPDWGGGHGVFTYYVVEGLKGQADENRDGTVVADELAHYVYTHVRDATRDPRDAPDGTQNPTWDRGSFDPNMPLSYNVKALAERPQLGSGTLILEANVDDVEVFVDGQSKGVIKKGKLLRLPGLRPGPYTIKGVKMGYEPDGPREEIVYPGQETTVSIKILIPRRRSAAALELLDKGIEFYKKGDQQNHRKATEKFEAALKLEPAYSQAASYLGRSYGYLGNLEKAESSFRQAIKIDPDYTEARVAFAGVLLDSNVDEAIRQLNDAVLREPDRPIAYYLLAQAFRMKNSYSESIEFARKAIQLSPNNAEAHFWLAESLRMSGSYEKAKAEYWQYLNLSDFESEAAAKLFNYYIRGFLVGGGKKSRADQKESWRMLRGLAFQGLGDCERLSSRLNSAIDYYYKSLSYDREDALVHYALGHALYRKAEIAQSAETLPEAREHFLTMLKLNPHLTEATKAKKYVDTIEATLQGGR